MGTRSFTARRCRQDGQWDGGEIIDWRAGRRSMQTLRKLAMTAPSTVKMAMPIASISLYILDVSDGIVKWINRVIGHRLVPAAARISPGFALLVVSFVLLWYNTRFSMG